MAALSKKNFLPVMGSSAMLLRQRREIADEAARGLLLPLLLLATVVGTAAVLLSGAGRVWPHSMVQVEAALALAQLGVLAAFAVFGNVGRAFSICGLILAAAVWSDLLGGFVLGSGPWWLVLGCFVVPSVTLFSGLRVIKFRLSFAGSEPAAAEVKPPSDSAVQSARGVPRHEADASARESALASAAQRRRAWSRWQFSLGTTMGVITLLAVVSAAARNFDVESGSSGMGIASSKRLVAELTPFVFAVALWPVVLVGAVFAVLFAPHGGDGREGGGGLFTLAITVLAMGVLCFSATQSGRFAIMHAWFGIFTAAYFCVLRQCGFRLVRAVQGN